MWILELSGLEKLPRVDVVVVENNRSATRPTPLRTALELDQAIVFNDTMNPRRAAELHQGYFLGRAADTFSAAAAAAASASTLAASAATASRFACSSGSTSAAAAY